MAQPQVLGTDVDLMEKTIKIMMKVALGTFVFFLFGAVLIMVFG